MTTVVARAPGRVNLIGEHTDYNNGFVLPAALALETRVIATPRDDRMVSVRSRAFVSPPSSEAVTTFDLDALAHGYTGHWSDNVRGMLVELQRAGCGLRGCHLSIEGDLPIGAGLSSSASVEIAAGLALLGMAGVEFDRIELARVAQRAEHEHVGTRCGIMDQMVCALAREGTAMMLETGTLLRLYVPLPTDVVFVIVNSMVKHDVADGAYNERRAQCEEAVTLLRRRFTNVRALCDVTPSQLSEARGDFEADAHARTLYRRARHVVTENPRVLEAARALNAGDFEAFGSAMNASHASLRDDYQVSCAELDTLVEIAQEFGAYGARMTGGGFGGSTVNLVSAAPCDAFCRHIAEEYAAKTGKTPEIYLWRWGARRRRYAAGSPVSNDWLKRDSHRRFNPLTGEWVLVSPQRTERPWLGDQAGVALEQRPEYDPACSLCPRNVRASGERNPQYTTAFVFDNDFPALHPPVSTEESRLAQDVLLAEPEAGVCRVVCFSPQHDLTVSRMSQPQLRAVIDAWAREYLELGALPWINAVTIFENNGRMMGASNVHPHGQVWANATLPNEMLKENAAFSRDECVLCRYVRAELQCGERVVHAGEHFVVVVPFWAIWPFEALVIPRRHLPSLERLEAAERDDLAAAMQTLAIQYDALFDAPFPYSMGFHQAPTDAAPHPEWHMHAHYYPPLLRSATVRKFMVGYEMLAMPQRDLTPEEAARRLRA